MLPHVRNRFYTGAVQLQLLERLCPEAAEKVLMAQSWLGGIGSIRCRNVRRSITHSPARALLHQGDRLLRKRSSAIGPLVRA